MEDVKGHGLASEKPIGEERRLGCGEYDFAVSTMWTCNAAGERRLCVLWQSAH